jgi:hypothetical protein
MSNAAYKCVYQAQKLCIIFGKMFISIWFLKKALETANKLIDYTFNIYAKMMTPKD